ncbi:MAG: tripartite tricarboxylate transporter substrate binding protein [Sulfuricaulis sp.]|nr:tripartite tricarboxylate transporter substrate binding protein [Sulfuricaulis sp.]
MASAADAVARYPERSIRLLIGFPPGGGTDALARIIAPKLAESLGTQWVVDNRGGAGGNLATEIVARAQPDGYTLLLSLSTSLTVNPSLYGKLPFDVLRDLQPIIMLAEYDHILVVHAASVPAASLKEFIALAKSKPGSLNYSSSGIGGTPHMAAELFKHRAEVNLTHVPYKGGGPAAAAVLAGEVQVMFGTFPSLLPHTKSGRLRALATTGTKRSPLTPELPTIAESGFPGFEATGWIGLLAPAKTPQPIIKVLHSEALKALALPEVQEALSRQGLFESTTSSPAQFTAYIKQETQTWTRIIKSAGIRAE